MQDEGRIASPSALRLPEPPSEDQPAAVDTAALLDEVERLRQRVGDLEFTVAEYRNQMSQVLSSASWRVTSPLRGVTSRQRAIRARIRRWFRRRAVRSNGASVRLAGLVPPAPDRLPLTSPLRRPAAAALEANAGLPHRQAAQDHPARTARVLVLAHVHYPELWGDIDDRLSRMPEAFDLLITVTEGTAEAVVPTIRARWERASIEIVPNIGRDWGPAVLMANRGLLGGYAAVAKVHTKKSEHRVDGDGWRLALLDGVLESPEAIDRILALLEQDRSVGLVVPTGHVGGPEAWGSDQGIVEALAARRQIAFDPDAIAFPAGSMFWCRPWLLEQLAELQLEPEHFEVEAGQYDGTTAHALERLMGVLAQVGGMDVVEAMDVASRLRLAKRRRQRPRVLAFALPQYHRTPENDAFWGDGFTDWVNVAKAEAIFPGHRQPLLPGEDVGCYDLAEPRTLVEHAERIRLQGIDGLLLHHYWFDGRKVLDTPLRNLLADPGIDLPFALCWANEPWTRRWDGLDHEVLIEQQYGPQWAERFYADIRPALEDPRYVRIEGGALLVLYRIDQIPGLAAAIAAWRSLAAADGLGLHVLGVLPARDFGDLPADASALDGFIAFPPGSGVRLESLRSQIPGASVVRGDVLSYDAAADSPMPELVGAFVHPGVMPGWDNTARRGRDAYVFHGANPLAFRRWVQRAAAGGRGLLFVNAWNEWAEGAAIEGGGALGTAILDALGPQRDEA